mmetsp:Transcript_58618/g.165445  ORF Transcript_58618/g.165445 Transcript_58618/m.165445 type:complete len:258 (+) Transcript_58618:180-953(+)
MVDLAGRSARWHALGDGSCGQFEGSSSGSGSVDDLCDLAVCLLSTGFVWHVVSVRSVGATAAGAEGQVAGQRAAGFVIIDMDACLGVNLQAARGNGNVLFQRGVIGVLDGELCSAGEGHEGVLQDILAAAPAKLDVLSLAHHLHHGNPLGLPGLRGEGPGRVEPAHPQLPVDAPGGRAERELERDRRDQREFPRAHAGLERVRIRPGLRGQRPRGGDHTVRPESAYVHQGHGEDQRQHRPQATHHHALALGPEDEER